ncbi:MAG: hypothetical protein ABI162_07175 [Luteolibacter sp.]
MVKHRFAGRFPPLCKPSRPAEGVLRIRRPNPEYLLRIRAGEFEYEELVTRAEQQLAEVIEAFEKSTLPEQPDRDQVNRLLVEIREVF